jgi:serine/threonine protein kinase
VTQPHELQRDYWIGIESDSDFWYNVADKLDEGEGGTSSIYHVVRSAYKSDRETVAKGGGISYVMKIITRDREELKTRLNAEKEFLLETDHPSVLNCYDAGHWHEYPFYIAEYLPKTLRPLMEQNLSQAIKLNIAIQLVSSLIELEQSEPAIVHRDIKPRNIFISGNKAVLGDFGIMKFIGGEVDDVEDIWEDSTQKAMPYFYPTPELIDYSNNEADLTTKTNTYQLGLILAELFTGNNPANPADNTEDGLVYNDRDEVRFVPGNCGGQIRDLIEDMLIEEASDRPEASEILESWEGIMNKVAETTYNLNGFVFE